MDTRFARRLDQRLIVILPDCLADHMALAHQIYRMAARENLEVFYLALVDDDERLLAVSRALATLKAVTSGNHLTVNSRAVKPVLWFTALEELYRPGDRVVCHTEHEIEIGPRKTTVKVSDFLEDRIKAPIVTVSGFYQPEPVKETRWWQGLLAWAGFLVIMAVFAWLGFRVDQAVQGAVGTILLVLIV